MSDLKQLLSVIDDDYLVGISNKGIVKRAYKDKEECACEILGSIDDEVVEVKTGEETVKIKSPLSESECSCPSRSICRHVVLGIIVLAEAAKSDVNDTVQVETDSVKEIDASENSEIEEENDSLKTKLEDALKEFPLEKIRKAMSASAFEKVASRLNSGAQAKITKGSVISVELPASEYKVTLLMPLEHSSCTCHKLDFCAHKAEAIFWYKAQEGLVEEASLTSEVSKARSLDMNEISETAVVLKDFLESVIETGLARISNDILDSIDRMALVCHNSLLANYESYFRAYRESISSYLSRKASVRSEVIMLETYRLYKRVLMLADAKDDASVSKLAGIFKNEYKYFGDMELTAITMNTFKNRSGYEGETYYFLENNTKKWYTFTNSRPVFYDTKKRHIPDEFKKTPWGLNVGLDSFHSIHFKLKNAKCDNRNRLSSSQEIKGELLGNAVIDYDLISSCYYSDFGKLFEEQIRLRQNWAFDNDDNEKEQDYEARLVFVHPKIIDEPVFDRKAQRLRLKIYDENKREISVELQYSKDDANSIVFLENLKVTEKTCFVGRIYLNESRLCLYPISVFDIDFELPLIETVANAVLFMELDNEDYMLSLLSDVMVYMGDIFQGGMSSIGEGVLENLESKAKMFDAVGLSTLAKFISDYVDSNRRLNGLFDEDKRNLIKEMIKQNSQMIEYICVANDKVQYDKAQKIYK